VALDDVAHHPAQAGAVDGTFEPGEEDLVVDAPEEFADVAFQDVAVPVRPCPRAFARRRKGQRPVPYQTGAAPRENRRENP